ncbi:MAG: APC family permease [archaeon]
MDSVLGYKTPWEGVKDFFIGKRISIEHALGERLRKTIALAVFSSDALSSTAYATEAILLVLLAGGVAALKLSLPISLAIAALMLVVGFSYFQTVHTYPNGGGSYVVSRENLGALPGLFAAGALLVDYVLTVSVSVSAGVAALISAFPIVSPLRIELVVAIIFFIGWMNLRGVKESGTFFAIPTYSFVFAVFSLLAAGFYKYLTGQIVPLPAPAEALALTGPITLFLILRAFAGGCTALTGIEAISNGIPAFKPPESENAGKTLIAMVLLLSSMFLGISFLAKAYGIVALEGANTTVLSQIGGAVFGKGLFFYFMQLTTFLILSVAANTSFADFPRLSSLAARDGYLPSKLAYVGRRLVFSNGIILLTFAASLVAIAFGAREQRMLPLYAVGVFLSFTLSQLGMVIHWVRERKKLPIFEREKFRKSAEFAFHLLVNSTGALVTFVVFLILLVTKFAQGAWIAFVAIPSLVGVFLWTKSARRKVFY